MLTEALKSIKGIWKILNAWACADGVTGPLVKITRLLSGCSSIAGYGLLFLFDGCHIARQLIRVKQVGDKPEIILLFSPRGIFSGIKPHTDIEVAVADLSLQRIDLQEIIDTEFYIAADAVQAIRMLLERGGDIGDPDIGELENGIVAKLYFRPEPDIRTYFVIDVLRQIFLAGGSDDVGDGQFVRLEVKPEGSFSSFDLLEPKRIVDYFAAEADIAAVDLTREIAEQERRIVDGKITPKIMEVVRVFFKGYGEVMDR